MRQYYKYGQGMAEVLATQDLPGGEAGTGDVRRMLRPNSGVFSALDVHSVLRRLSIGAGRITGLFRLRRSGR